MASKNFKETKVFKLAFDQAMDILETSKSLHKEETYSLTDKVRRTSRSVCTNLAEAFGKNVIRHISFPKSLIVTEKILKLMFGLIWPWPVNISHNKSMKQ